MVASGSIYCGIHRRCGSGSGQIGCEGKSQAWTGPDGMVHDGRKTKAVEANFENN